MQKPICSGSLKHANTIWHGHGGPRTNCGKCGKSIAVKGLLPMAHRARMMQRTVRPLTKP